MYGSNGGGSGGGGAGGENGGGGVAQIFTSREYLGSVGHEHASPLGKTLTLFCDMVTGEIEARLDSKRVYANVTIAGASTNTPPPPELPPQPEHMRTELDAILPPLKLTTPAPA